jgi:hypothetical protein
MADTEFGGGPGLIQQHNINNQHYNDVEELWMIYASDTLSTDEPSPDRVGVPWPERSAAPAPTGVAPLPPLNQAR